MRTNVKKLCLKKLFHDKLSLTISDLPPCSEFYFCTRSLVVLAVTNYFPSLSLKNLQSAKFRAALIFDLRAKYFRALSNRNDPENFFELWSGVFWKFNRLNPYLIRISNKTLDFERNSSFNNSIMCQSTDCNKIWVRSYWLS